MTSIALVALALVPSGHAYTYMENSQGYALGWSKTPIQFFVNPANPYGLTDDEVEDAALDAAESWEAVGAAIQFEYLGFTDKAEKGFDGENVVYFDETWEEGEGKAAMTYNWSTDTGDIVAFDIGINAIDLDWSVDEAVPSMDLQNTLAHELGHVLGLGHSDIDDLATMHELTESGELIKRTLRPDDENGLLSIYGAELPMGLACSSALTSRSRSGSGSSLGWLVGLAAAGLALRRRRD